MNGVVGAVMRAGAEGFVSNGNVSQKRQAYMDFVVTLLTFVIAVLLLSFFGKFLWNNVVVDLFSFAKPAKSLWQILGLMVFIGLVLPCCP
jgi:hypothetical protein